MAINDEKLLKLLLKCLLNLTKRRRRIKRKRRRSSLFDFDLEIASEVLHIYSKVEKKFISHISC